MNESAIQLAVHRKAALLFQMATGPVRQRLHVACLGDITLVAIDVQLIRLSLQKGGRVLLTCNGKLFCAKDGRPPTMSYFSARTALALQEGCGRLDIEIGDFGMNNSSGFL
ncbi:MAG: hypothetical protein OXI60_08355 [Acidiferrobacterales bacterium]|nr:hypothetical protein [Acidiferrobacterales bacterium]